MVEKIRGKGWGQRARLRPGGGDAHTHTYCVVKTTPAVAPVFFLWLPGRTVVLPSVSVLTRLRGLCLLRWDKKKPRPCAGSSSTEKKRSQNKPANDDENKTTRKLQKKKVEKNGADRGL
ncbi:hypothetical protein TW95_gp1414 [Pandoravirus inopinatum]|uniref:Uncharacterized protein n=1 Tax=Pandoravirus inopinatum TaxID=1605721 RepID=A0A0B5IZ55_9VIRU|nr:hypothetical protein TW95_gp1414 [Pandoravirus inopinatum]AJF98148.1 hypothetical protein [Pandoravirus inopinatum]